MEEKRKEKRDNIFSLIGFLIFIFLPSIALFPLYYHCELYSKILIVLYMIALLLFGFATIGICTSENSCKISEFYLSIFVVLPFFIILPLTAIIFSFSCNVFWGIIFFLLYMIAHIFLILGEQISSSA